MKVLGIETSCDDTGIAIYDDEKGVLAQAMHSQHALHAEFGGVVPELASRDHLQKILPLIEKCLAEAKVSSADIDLIAYTKGPGLIGSLLVGAMTAKSLALQWSKPCFGVHHLEAHIMSAFLSDEQTSLSDEHTKACAPEYPFCCLLVSGGHTLLIAVDSFSNYKIIGQTLDDALGEAFDKTAKLLGLPYPGGPALSACAELSKKPDRFVMPRPMVKRPGCDFSFSGLKTHVRQLVEEITLDDESRSDIAAAFEIAVTDTLCIKVKRALAETGYDRLVCCGGVSANKRLRAGLTVLCESIDAQVFFPPLKYCTDNGAMVAIAGSQYFDKKSPKHNLVEDSSVNVKARWPLSAANDK